MRPAARILLAALLLTSTSLLVPAAGAGAASSGTVITADLDATWRPVVSLTANLTAGDKMYLYGRYTATNSSANPVLQAAQVMCTDQTSASAVSSPWSTTNHLGSASGTQFIAVRALLSIPTTSTYSCKLLARAAQSASPGTARLLHVVTGSGTGLSMTDAPQPGGAQWGDVSDVVIPAGSSQYVLRKTWVAASTATTVSFRADPELNEENTALDAFTTSTLSVAQLTTAGVACEAAHTVTVPLTVTHDRHHAKVYLNITGLPINTAAGCTRSFAVKVLVSAGTGGSPVRVYNSLYSNGIALNGTVTV